VRGSLCERHDEKEKKLSENQEEELFHAMHVGEKRTKRRVEVGNWLMRVPLAGRNDEEKFSMISIQIPQHFLIDDPL
jgi:hypothetical protein